MFQGKERDNGQEKDSPGGVLRCATLRFIEQLERRVLFDGPDGSAQIIEFDPQTEGQQTTVVVRETDFGQFDFRDENGLSQDYGIEWGDGNADTFQFDRSNSWWEYTQTLQHVYDDNGNYTISLVQMDNDGQMVSGPTYDPIAIADFAPAATVSTSFNDSTNTLTADLTEPYDPSQADTNAGFHYSVSTNYDALAQNYGDATDSPSMALNGDLGTQEGWIRIFDKDNGYRDYNTTLKVPDLAVVASTSSSINLTWQDVMPNSASYRIERSTDGENFSIYKNIGREDLTFDQNGLITWNDTGLDDGTKYWYRVRAVDDNNADNNSGYSPKKDDVTPLQQPTDVMATNLNNETNDIAVNWTNPSPRYDHVVLRAYPIIDGVTSSTPSTTVTLAGDATSYTLTGNPADAGFSFTLQGENALTSSSESAPAQNEDDPHGTWVSPVGYNTARPEEAPHAAVVSSPLTTGTNDNGNPYSYIGDYTADQTFTETVTGLTRHTWARMHGEVDFDYVGGESGDDFNPTPRVTMDGQDIPIASTYTLDPYNPYQDTGWRGFGIDAGPGGFGTEDAFRHTSDQMTITISMSGLPPGWRWTPEVFVDTYLPFVSISGDGTTIEDGSQLAHFTVTRTGDGTVLSDPLVVAVGPSVASAEEAANTATEGLDYQALQTITIPAGQGSGSKDVVPVDDTGAEGVEDIYQSVRPEPIYALAAPPATAPDTNPTTGKANIDDDVTIQSIRVARISYADATGTQPTTQPNGDPAHDFNRYYGYDFAVRITLTGEHLDKVGERQEVLSRTAMIGTLTGNTLDPNDPFDANTIAGLLGYDPNVPNPLLNNSDYELDPGPADHPNANDWHFVPVKDGTKNGVAEWVDFQTFTMVDHDAGIPGVNVRYADVVMRTMKFMMRFQGLSAQPEVDEDWGYYWTNDPCLWTAFDGGPVAASAASNRHLGIGRFDSNNVEGLDDLNIPF